jgi:hypothetical protein
METEVLQDEILRLVRRVAIGSFVSDFYNVGVWVAVPIVGDGKIAFKLGGQVEVGYGEEDFRKQEDAILFGAARSIAATLQAETVEVVQYGEDEETGRRDVVGKDIRRIDRARLHPPVGAFFKSTGTPYLDLGAGPDMELPIRKETK